MPDPVFLEPIVQKDSGDCGTSCLAMLSGQPYPEVVRLSPSRAHKRGMSMRQIRATGAKLGINLALHRKYDLKEDIGILGLIPEPRRRPGSKISRDEHVVLLIEGQIYDTLNGRLWLDVDVFLQAEGYKVGTLLRMEG